MDLNQSDNSPNENFKSGRVMCQITLTLQLYLSTVISSIMKLQNFCYLNFKPNILWPFFNFTTGRYRNPCWKVFVNWAGIPLCPEYFMKGFTGSLSNST